MNIPITAVGFIDVDADANVEWRWRKLYNVVHSGILGDRAALIATSRILRASLHKERGEP